MESKRVVLSNDMVHVDKSAQFLRVRTKILPDDNCYPMITIWGPVRISIPNATAELLWICNENKTYQLLVNVTRHLS